MTADNDPLKLDRQLCFPLYAATNLLVRAYRPLLEPLGLTYSQYLVMLVLWERDTASVGDLARCLFLDSGTLTPLLKRMEKAGFIARRRDSEDERRVLIELTAHGSGLRKKAQDVPRALAKQLNLKKADGEVLRKSAQDFVQTLAEQVLAD